MRFAPSQASAGDARPQDREVAERGVSGERTRARRARARRSRPSARRRARARRRAARAGSARPGAQCVTGKPACAVAHTTNSASAASAGTVAGASRSAASLAVRCSSSAADNNRRRCGGRGLGHPPKIIRRVAGTDDLALFLRGPLHARCGRGRAVRALARARRGRQGRSRVDAVHARGAARPRARSRSAAATARCSASCTGAASAGAWRASRSPPAAVAIARERPGDRRGRASTTARACRTPTARSSSASSRTCSSTCPTRRRCSPRSARVCASVVVEVPLEANWSARRASKREHAAEVGHLQRLDRDSRARDRRRRRPARSRGELRGPAAAAPRTASSPRHPPSARRGGCAKWAVRSAIHALAPALARRAVHGPLRVLCSCAGRVRRPPAA